MPRIVLHTVLVLSVGTGGCWFRKPPRTFVPPTPVAISIPEELEEIPPPPDVTLNLTATLPPVPATLGDYPGPPVTPTNGRPRRPGLGPSKPAQVEETPIPVTPPPKLGQLYTPEQRRDYNRAIDESLDRVRRTLAVASRKSLNSELSETVARIRTFQRQAEDARDQDLVTALNLAKRADVLAQDLMARLQ